jgi:hypothetical protein
MDGVKKLIGIYDASANPDAYYTSQVEKNKKAPLGVTIATFRPQDRTVDNESEVIVHGVVKAQSFIGSTVTIEPACIIDRKGAPSGSVDPVITEIVYGSSQSFACTFPPLATGTYSVLGSVTFPFETWAYISYTFVDDERARNFAKQGLDVKQELGIAEEPVAIFTSGPVKVGMGGSTMPILVKPEGPQLLQSGTRIGITIDPAWEYGELQRVERIELKVPKPFLLGKCDRNQTQEPQQDLLDPEYTTYVFQNPSHGPITTHTSLTCSLNITDAAAAAELVKGQDKSIRSFVAVVKYRYAVEQKTTVQVR